MTNTMIVDTLKFSQNLQKAGLDPKIADTLTQEINNIQEINLENLVTKQDLKNELQNLEYKLTIRLGTMMGLTIAIVSGIQKLL